MNQLNVIMSAVIGGLLVVLFISLKNTGFQTHYSMTSDSDKIKCEYLDFEMFKEKFLSYNMTPDFKYKYSFFDRTDWKLDNQYHASIVSFNGVRYKAINSTEYNKIKKFCKQIWIAEKSKQM